MKTIQKLSCYLAAGLLSVTAFAHDPKAPLNEGQKQFLGQYEDLRAALAADDLAAARKAASTIADASKAQSEEKAVQRRAEAANKLAQAATLADAREAFKVISKSAVHLAEGKEGYYIALCPMVPNEEGHWVQTTKKISNPYLGKAMATCGSIEQ